MPVRPTQPVKAYLCECGKKWTLRQKSGTTKTTSFTCDCGRVIVLRHGMAFSIGKPSSK